MLNAKQKRWWSQWERQLEKRLRLSHPYTWMVYICYFKIKKSWHFGSWHLGVDILGVDILGVDILRLTHSMHQASICFVWWYHHKPNLMHAHSSEWRQLWAQLHTILSHHTRFATRHSRCSIIALATYLWNRKIQMQEHISDSGVDVIRGSGGHFIQSKIILMDIKSFTHPEIATNTNWVLSYLLLYLTRVITTLKEYKAASFSLGVVD